MVLRVQIPSDFGFEALPTLCARVVDRGCSRVRRIEVLLEEPDGGQHDAARLAAPLPGVRLVLPPCVLRKLYKSNGRKFVEQRPRNHFAEEGYLNRTTAEGVQQHLNKVKSPRI